MRRFTSTLILLACTVCLTTSTQAAWWSRDNTLVTIDGTRYSTEDFKRWWQFWKEEGDSLPKTLDPYVDWLLMVREGERMELTTDPAFRHGVNVFLKSRALLMLKAEAVNSQIELTEAALRAYYDQNYSPRWLVQHLIFQDGEAAAAAYQELVAEAVSVADLIARGPDAGGPASQAEDWLRPSKVDPGWAAIFRKLEVGEVADPSEHQGGQGLFVLKDRREGDEEDFAKLRESIRRKLWREQESALTRKLLGELRQKFQVAVDEEHIAGMDLNAADDTFTDAVVISNTMQNVTERDFIQVVRRLMANRTAAAHAVIDEEAARKLKAQTVENIIAQQVTDWEALDRHFEQREPFKWEFEFAVRHRLTTALQDRLFASQATVTEAEVEEEYATHVESYTSPEMVRVVILDDTQGPVGRVWADVATGGDFLKVVRELFDREVPPQTVPLNHLDPAVKEVVEKLVKGETSQPFHALGSQVVVHLQERTPAQPIPLKRVASTIRSRLEKAKVRQARTEYLDLLKSRSRIEIKERTWQAVREELGGA